MSTEFISFLAPPGRSISSYDRSVPHDSQVDGTIPSVFLEAMSIREEVFVNEQKVPLGNELDVDDSRSFHWVTYASVGSSKGSQSRPADPNEKRGSTANRLAVGVVRLVPPPHPPHPQPGSSHQIDNAEDREKVPPVKDAKNTGPTSSFNPHNEPYVKIGRLATLPAFRGLGLAKLLMDTAMNWAAKHPNEVLPPKSAAMREAARMEGEPIEIEERWNGLVLVHAQQNVVGLYKKWGFTTDENMGEWEEEGIMHVGMWRRLHVQG